MVKKTKKKSEAIKNFRYYEKGVRRLQELEKELNKLNTRKFKTEEKTIRKKLKNVALIPEIEEDLRILKLRIAGVDTDALEAKIDKRQDRKLRKLSAEEKELELKVKKAKELTREELEDVEKIPRLRQKIKLLQTEIEFAEKLARKKELSPEERKDIDKIPLIRNGLHMLGEILKEKAKKLEIAIRRKRFYTRSKIIGELKQNEALDKEQENKINFLKKEAGDLNNIIPVLIQRINEVDKKLISARKAKANKIEEFERKLAGVKSSESRKIKNLSEEIEKTKSLENRKINVLKETVEKPGFFKNLQLFRKKTSERFSAYSTGVKRLHELEKELNSLDTRGFKHQENIIRKKLKNVSLIPEIEQDIRELKMRMAGIDVDYKKSITDKQQDLKLSRVSGKLSSLRNDEENLNEKLASIRNSIRNLRDAIERIEKIARRREINRHERKEINSLPELKRRLTELVEKDSKMQDEIENLKKLRIDTSMLTGRVMDLDTREKSIEQEIEGLPKFEKKISGKTGFISRIFKRDREDLNQLQNKVDTNMLNINDRLVKEIAESRRMLEEEKYNLKQQILELLGESVRKLQDEKKESDKKILSEIEGVRQKILEEKKDINESFISKIVQLKSKIDESKKELTEESSERFDELKKRFEEIEAMKKEEEKIEKIPDIEPRPPVIEEKKFKPVEITPAQIKKEVIKLSLPEILSLGEKKPELVEKKKEKASPKRKIPKKTFFEYPRFKELVEEIEDLKFTVEKRAEVLGREISEDKKLAESTVLKCSEILEKIKADISKISSDLSWK